MLEDSISSSPCKSNKSIHEARLIRKNKRKKADEILQPYSDHEKTVCPHKAIIHNFYKDCENEDSENEAENSIVCVAKPPAIIRNYIPFEIEKSLAIADQMSTHQNKQNIANVWPETQGFFTCQTLAELELQKDQQSKNLSDNYNENKSFSITESELISCCHKAENILQCSTLKEIDNANFIAQELSPKKIDDMFLVNSILEDFSQSPLSKEQTKISTSYQFTPEFRLRRQPQKTYSRKFLNSTKTNLNKRFEEQNIVVSDDDDDHSSCSSLSIQEDVTYRELSNNNATPTSANNSQRLCENLLNLSVYFTQNNQYLSDDISQYEHQRDSNLFSDKMSELVNDILTIRSMYPQKIRYDSYNSIEDFHGFRSHMDADEKVSIDIEKDELDTMHTTLNITHGLSNYENQVSDISLNEEENATFGDWNEDNCHDVFECINTENILQEETVKNQKKRLTNIEQFTVTKSPKNNEIHTVPDILKQNHPVNNSVGFKTASSKPIKVSREAHIMAAKILSKLPEIQASKSTKNTCDTENVKEDVNIFPITEDYEWNDDCDLFLNFQTPITSKAKHETEHDPQNETIEQQVSLQQVQVFPSTSKMTAQGFKTAGGKNVQISKKAQDSVQELLKEFVSENKDNSYNSEENLREIKCKMYAKTHNFQTKLSDIKVVKNIRNGDHIIDANIGFQTANGKTITTSAKAQQSVKSIINEFCVDQEQSFENNLEIMKQNINKKNNESKHSITVTNVSKNVQTNTCKSNEFSKEAQEKFEMNIPQLLENNMGFKTANGKRLIISSQAKKSVDKMLKELFEETKEDFISDLKSIKNNVNKKNDKHKMTVRSTDIVVSNNFSENDESFTNLMLSEWPLAKQVETASNEDTIATVVENTNTEKMREKTIANKVLHTNLGFKTANGKQVSISAKAQQTVEKLLQEFNTDLDIEKGEYSLIGMKTKIEIKNAELKNKKQKCSSSIKLKSSQVYNDNNDITLGEGRLKPENVIQQDITPKPIKGKRKHSINCEDIATPGTSTSPPAKLVKRGLYNSKSSFAEETLKSPKPSVIGRKNLLSLTKRRRSKRNSLTLLNEEIPKVNKEKYDINAAVITPIKSSVSLAANAQTPATPNLRDFLSNAPLTSTPTIAHHLNSPQTIKDTDFRPIMWKSNNDSIISSNHTTKLSDTSSLNITLNSPNPTVQERIGRLKMYGKAPAVSPILIETNHNCRPSGLRRTRSMLKKTEK